MAVPYTFGSATTSIPLSQLDSNFATTITLGNTAVQLGNTITNLTGVSNLASASALSLGSNGNTTAITVDTSQNVGINTTSPATKLNVAISAANETTSALRVTNLNTSGYGVGIEFSDEFSVSGRVAARIATNTPINGPTADLYFQTRTASALTEKMRLTSTGLLQFNSGYGSVATAYGCRVWLQFNGTGTISITGSGNVSSLTDYGVGDYAVSFTTSMPDTSYCAVGASIKGGGGPSVVNSGVISMSENIYTTGCGISVISASSGAIDRAAVFVAVFR